ncbi:3-ketosteroid-1-dehydrogenase [Rhizodiscina lignyota]|uniref:3-ketosteroid-1-dehydrogenase n=1 Tax=Rhizodiscina lignyota TaxID=1504668 RepID=A0A9P4MB22_9PEZI|nr:3-ketosteroid-1-dehydrogenase [Rhizodiscina lignyota]
MTKNEYDVVVVGSGASGLSAAIRAHDLGLRVVILEAYNKVGGSSAFSAGQVWVGKNHLMIREGIEDTLEETRAYVKALNDDPSKLDEQLLEQWITEAPRVLEDLERCQAMKWELIRDFPDYYYPQVAGSKSSGRYLAAAPLDGAALGELRPKLLYSPHHPPGPTYAEIFGIGGDINKLDALIAQRQAEDVLTMGTGVAAHLLVGLRRRGVPILTGHRGIKLVRNNDAVTGIECKTSDGRTTFNGTVILATGSYDWNFDLVNQYSEMRREETGSVAPPGIRGDGHLMAREIGADIVKMPIDRAMHIPGYRMASPHQDDLGFRYGASTMGWPHSMLVDSTGKRFCDDSYYRSVVTAIATGKGTNPFFLVWDEDHHQKYGLPPAGPGQPYPGEMKVSTAPSLRELASKLNIDADTFVASVERFNKYAKEGKDPDFKRGENDWAVKFLGDPSHKPSSLLGPIERGPFFGMNWRILNTGIGNAGVRTGLNGQVLDTAGNVISGLYAIGVVSSPSMMGTGYNSGFSVCRGLVFGYLAVEHIVRAKDTRSKI